MIDAIRMQRNKVVPFLAPAMFIAAAVVLTRYVDENPDRTAEMVRGGFGPTAWPSYMLYGVMFFAAGWLLQELLAFWRAQIAAKEGRPARPASQGKASDVLEPRVLVAIGLIAAYGYLIPTIGFAFATLLFFLTWFVLGGLRKPGMIGAVAIGGTLFMLYLFVKLAAMPLSRGEGVFGDLTVALYQMLKVF